MSTGRGRTSTITSRGGAVALLGLAVLASMLAGCRDEDLDDLERASRIETARAEAARLHAEASYSVMELTELDGLEELSAAIGFDVVMPRGLPSEIEIRSVMAQLPIEEPNGGEQPALASVTMQAPGRTGVLQLVQTAQQPGVIDAGASGEPVPIGDDVGLLTYPAGDGSNSLFSGLTFEGCGLRLGLSAVNLDGVPPFTTEELVASAEATLAACRATDAPAGVRYFLSSRDDLESLTVLEARVGFDAVLPSYLPEGMTPSLVFGQPLLPGAVGMPDVSLIVALYGRSWGTLSLQESTRRGDLGVGEALDVAGVPARLEHGAAIDGDPVATLTWDACGLRFALAARTSPEAPATAALPDDELVRVAESILEGCA